MNIARLLVCSVLMSLIMIIMLYLYCTQVQSIISELDAASKPMDNMIWVVENLARLFPMIAVAIFQLVVYSGDGNIRGLYHREQRIECIIAMLFTFLIMLPFVYIKNRANEAVDNEGTVGTAVFEQTYMWFATQLIPFVILIMYHGVRYKAEQSLPESSAEPSAELSAKLSEAPRDENNDGEVRA